MAGQPLPSLGLERAFVPFSAVRLPLAAKKAYARAVQIAVAVPSPTIVPMYEACEAVRLVNVRAAGLRPGIAGNVKLDVAPPTISPVKNPDSCRRLCSKDAKKYDLSFLIGPPSVAPY